MSASDLARRHTERAIETIASIMDASFAEDKDRLKAADMLLDRGHGKPAQAIIAVPGNRKQALLAATLTDEELMAVITQARLPRLAPIDAEFAEVIDPLLR